MVIEAATALIVALALKIATGDSGNEC